METSSLPVVTTRDATTPGAPAARDPLPPASSTVPPMDSSSLSRATTSARRVAPSKVGSAARTKRRDPNPIAAWLEAADREDIEPQTPATSMSRARQYDTSDSESDRPEASDVGSEAGSQAGSSVVTRSRSKALEESRRHRSRDEDEDDRSPERLSADQRLASFSQSNSSASSTRTTASNAPGHDNFPATREPMAPTDPLDQARSEAPLDEVAADQAATPVSTLPERRIRRLIEGGNLGKARQTLESLHSRE